MDITVAIDCMGGDHGPHVTVPAALEFQKSAPAIDLVLVGLRDTIESELRARRATAGPRAFSVLLVVVFFALVWLARSGRYDHQIDRALDVLTPDRASL